jgi:alpha-L-arabinofuranosidase
VFDLYRPHMGAEALPTEVETDTRTVEEGGGTEAVPLVSASASKDGDGVFVTLSNRALDPRTVRVELGAGTTPEPATAAVLFDGQDPAERATPGNADEFAPADLSVETDGGGVVVEAPPASVVAVELGD